VTEVEWLAATNSEELLRGFRAGAAHRKLLLLACGCCRRKWFEISDTALRQKVALAERYADGRITEEEFFQTVRDVQLSPTNHPVVSNLRTAVLSLGALHHDHSPASIVEIVLRIAEAAGYADAGSTLRNPRRSIHFRRARERELAAQAVLVRDVFGNPFRTVAFAPEWRTDTAVALAQQMYDSREFSALPILADALQDVGCADEDVLNHCRGNGPHVRGCWVVDRVLGR
jgi:hypothetical protein